MIADLGAALVNYFDHFDDQSLILSARVPTAFLLNFHSRVSSKQIDHELSLVEILSSYSNCFQVSINLVVQNVYLNPLHTQTFFSVFGNPDETMSLVFAICLQHLCYTLTVNTSISCFL